ncbi:MAG: glutamine-hydrolyzing carbamoyl-phosphate synthase small subunit [Nitriliruptorales bacterium]|nr:glutamine-hydrolyzing carbamoyl-phosphate synthase small subunit [Nitriliruptorales bacterium]
MADSLLVLEDGTAFRGAAFGAPGTAFGEVVFNTAMAGYQEVVTDPSYRRQLVTMTYPHQGNYGVNGLDAESDSVQAAGLIVREISRLSSNHRSEGSLHEYLAGSGVVGISEIDTRRLTRHIRSAGSMRAAISTEVRDVDSLVEQVGRSREMSGWDLATEAGTEHPYDVPAAGDTRFRVVAYDFGIKHNILRLLTQAGCRVHVVPAMTPAEEVLAAEPDGVFLSNGPGDPAAVRHGIIAIEHLLRHLTPVFGICLGHQLLARALGADTYKLRFGHRGANQPVRNLDTGHVEITSHNHGFAVDADTLGAGGPFGAVEQSHVNLNDDVNEGLRCLDVPAFSVQYHPEAAPGPHDARYLFGNFTDLMARVGVAANSKSGGAVLGEARRVGGSGDRKDSVAAPNEAQNDA